MEYDATDPEENAKLCGFDIGEEDKRKGMFDTTLPHGIPNKYKYIYVKAYLEANPQRE